MSRYFSIIYFSLSLTALSLIASPLAGAASPDAYGRLPAVELMQLSPSGKRYAFIASTGEKHYLNVLTDDGAVVFSRDLSAVKVRHIEWVNDSRLLLRTTTTIDRQLGLAQAHELSSLINIDLNTLRCSSIFEKTQKIMPALFGDAGSFQVDGHPYTYFIGLAYSYSAAKFAAGYRGGYFFNGDRRNLYRVNLDTNEISLQARGGDGANFDWVVDNNGEVAAHSEYDQLSGTWRLYAGKNRSKLLQEKSSPFNDTRLLSLGRTPNTVWIAGSSSGAYVTEEVSVANGKSTVVFTNVSPNQYLISSDSRLAIGATMAATPGAVLFDPKLQASLSVAHHAFRGLQMRLVSYSSDFDRLIVKTDGGTDSGTYWLIDNISGSASAIGYEYPELGPTDVSPTRWLSYKAADGLEIHAVLTLNPERKAEKLPLVVLPHGGPIGVQDSLGFDWWAQAFAAAGYAVLQPNYRGSAGVGNELLLAGFGQWGRKMQSDLSDGVAALAAQGLIDPKRVCIVGASYGGYAALAGVTLQRDIYRCAVSVAGPADLKAFFRWQIQRHGNRSDAARYWEALTGADSSGAMQTISPFEFADRASAPILLIHGDDDSVVPITQSEQMASALRGANKPVEFIRMKGEDHWLSRDGTRKAMLKASIAFVREHNPSD